jgi:hypothetical protein
MTERLSMHSSVQVAIKAIIDQGGAASELVAAEAHAPFAVCSSVGVSRSKTATNTRFEDNACIISILHS